MFTDRWTRAGGREWEKGQDLTPSATKLNFISIFLDF